MEVPDDAPDDCPVCGAPYDSVSRHADGLMVSLRETERYARVCFDPVTVVTDDGPQGRIDFYHHTHEQA
ncbi:hypothetical protein JCM30237_04160 [Halolamina litorea]|uniref:DUF8145 domain-containing protein n=1 Tax=Halolamina litorea TaxID=1515593 RepID=A0ABD6BP15_9EURY|nr:hypothetical protein [Halolamina litorea]